MTAKELLDLNGDFKSSPLIDTLRRIHKIFSEYRIPYAVIGGLAVVAHGGFRTTHDVDILTTHEAWDRIRKKGVEGFIMGDEYAKDEMNGVDIDILFEGDTWDMLIPMPDPTATAEFDDELGSNIINLYNLLQLKTAVYIKKREEDGIELAARDLSDVVELLKKNEKAITESFLSSMHPDIYKELKQIKRKIERRGG